MPAGDADLVVDDLIDEAMLVGVSARPVSLEAVLERLWLADAFIAVALNVGDQGVDPLQDLPVLLLLPDVVIPGGLIPGELHCRRSRSMPPPCSSRSIEASSRRRSPGSGAGTRSP
jgi:hypothetical protein